MPYLTFDDDDYESSSDNIQTIIHYDYNSTYHYTALIILSFLLYKFIMYSGYRMETWKADTIKNTIRSVFNLLYVCGACTFAFTLGTAIVLRKSDINISIACFVAMLLYNIVHIKNHQQSEKEKKINEWRKENGYK